MLPPTAIEIELTEEERFLLRQGMNEWGGPTNPTDALAAAMGFENGAGLDRRRSDLRDRVLRGEPLTRDDWLRVLTATEIAFVSDSYGSGQDWSITTGLSDSETIAILRSVQRKIGRALREN